MPGPPRGVIGCPQAEFDGEPPGYLPGVLHEPIDIDRGPGGTGASLRFAVLREVPQQSVGKGMPGVVRVVGIDVEAEAPRGSSPEAATCGNPVFLRVNAEFEGVLVSGDGEAVVD